MDPNEVLARLRAHLGSAERARSLAEANNYRELACYRFMDLDEWLTKGGFPPADWIAKPAVYEVDQTG